MLAYKADPSDPGVRGKWPRLGRWEVGAERVGGVTETSSGLWAASLAGIPHSVES